MPGDKPHHNFCFFKRCNLQTAVRTTFKHYYNPNGLFAQKMPSLTSKVTWHEVCKRERQKNKPCYRTEERSYMKANLLHKYILSGAAVGLVSALALPCMAGPGIIIVPPAPPAIVISAPPPPVPVVVAPPTVAVVPDDYYYDGTEYVGIVNGQYYYLGPGNAWVVMDPVRLHRFNVWIGAHPDWRTHYATHNVRYRGAPAAHAQPMHEDMPRPGGSDYGHNGPPH
jgi:hypothetical protein